MDHLKNLHWICYNIISLLCFGIFGCKAYGILAFLTWDQTHTPCIGRQSLNHWTTREVPLLIKFYRLYYCTFLRYINVKLFKNTIRLVKQYFMYLYFPALLRYNWHVTLCQIKRYKVWFNTHIYFKCLPPFVLC